MEAIADRKKYVAGWVILVISAALLVFFVIRREIEFVFVCAIFGWGGWDILRAAKKKREVAPTSRFLRWYHVLAVALGIGAIVAWLYSSS
jgi:hypothetical protein